MKKLIFATLTMLLTAQFSLAQSSFLKFELVDNTSGDTPTEVKVSIPLGMLEAMRPTFDDAMGHVEFEQHGVNLREIWQEVQAAGPNEYVNITEGDQTVRVSTTDTHIVVQVEGDENINLTIPLALGDAILGGENVDFDQVMEALNGMNGQDLLTITGDITARAWIE